MHKKINLLLMLILFSDFCRGQKPESDIKIYSTTTIWNYSQSEASFNIASIGYHQIPKNIEYRGVLVLSLQWTDASGENLLILTQSGSYPLNDLSKASKAAGAEIYAYLFHRADTNMGYKRRWKIYDFNECPDSICSASYYPRSVTVTDLDNDKIAEISLVYAMSCGNNDKPKIKKIAMYEADNLYEMKGHSIVCFQTAMGQDSIGGIYRADGKLISQKVFYEFLKTKWKICDWAY
jgi:hypothetical protein